MKEFFQRFHTACNSSHPFKIFHVAFFEISIKFSYLDTRISASYQLLAIIEQNLSIVCSGKIKWIYWAFIAACQQEPISEKAHCCRVNCIWGLSPKNWPLQNFINSVHIFPKRCTVIRFVLICAKFGICTVVVLKGTQAWEFFGLWFWNLYFFVVSYA